MLMVTSVINYDHWQFITRSVHRCLQHDGCNTECRTVICNSWVLFHVSSTTTTVLRPFFREHPGEPVPEENFWTLWCKRRLTEADTSTIRMCVTQSGLTSAYLHHPPFLQAGCPSCHPTNSVKALKATRATATLAAKLILFVRQSTWHQKTYQYCRQLLMLTIFALSLKVSIWKTLYILCN